MKVLYIDPAVHSPKSQSYQHYNYLYDQFSTLAECYLYRDENMTSILDALRLCPEKPDIIYFGMGWFALKEPAFEKNFNLDKVGIPSMGYLFKPQNFLTEKLNFLKTNGFSQIVTSVPLTKEYEETTGIPCKLLPQAADAAVFYDRQEEKQYDVGFSGALHDNKLYVEGAFKTVNIRSRLQELLNEQEGITTFLNGSDSTAPRIPSYDEYARKIHQCRMWLATPAPFEEVTGRYYEIGMSKTLLLCSEIKEEYKKDLQDGVNCVEFKDDLSDFLEKFYYYLNNWDESEKIIQCAHDDFHQKHTWMNRAQLLRTYMEDLING
jgi:spore maturation protein CgeB